MIQTRPIQKLVRIRKYDPEYTKSLRLINGVQTGQTSVDDAEYQDALAKIDAGEPTINGINDVTFILNGEFSFDISSKFDDMMSSPNPIADSIKQTKVGGALLGNGVIGNAVKSPVQLICRVCYVQVVAGHCPHDIFLRLCHMFTSGGSGIGIQWVTTALPHSGHISKIHPSTGSYSASS